MRIGAGLSGSLKDAPEAARLIEDRGYDFLTTGESSHNPFLPITLAAEHTSRVDLVTSIALAFARSPMDTAYIAWDLQRLSGGRFVLGLGSQVRGHIIRRYNMDWSAPARRMRDYVLAMRAVWDNWQNGGRLDFKSDHFNFNLMPPFFNPGPIEHPNVRVYLAAVNPFMLRVAGEVCDGVLLHPFNTARYTEETVLPNLKRGAEAAGRSLSDVEVSGGILLATGANDEEIDASRQAMKARIAFYGSTRVYAPVLNAHGWNDTAQKLYRMSVDGQWSEMPGEITDEMLETFAVTGDYDEIVDKIKQRFAGYADSTTFSIPVRAPGDEERLRAMVNTLREA